MPAKHLPDDALVCTQEKRERCLQRAPNDISDLKESIDLFERINAIENSDFKASAKKHLYKVLKSFLRENFSEEVELNKIETLTVLENGKESEGLGNYYKSNKVKGLKFTVKKAQVAGNHLVLDISTDE